MRFTTATHNHIAGLLTLQEQYLFANLSEQERMAGFVTTPFTVPQMETLIHENSIFIALDNEVVVAYAYTGTWEYFSQWAIFPYMESRLSKLHFRGHRLTAANTFQYGPVCIDKKYRGSGLFQQLFEYMRLQMCKPFPIGITFINQVNTVSYQAHTRKLGLEVIDSFEFNGKQYYGLAFDTNASVVG